MEVFGVVFEGRRKKKAVASGPKLYSSHFEEIGNWLAEDGGGKRTRNSVYEGLGLSKRALKRRGGCKTGVAFKEGVGHELSLEHHLTGRQRRISAEE